MTYQPSKIRQSAPLTHQLEHQARSHNLQQPRSDSEPTSSKRGNTVLHCDVSMLIPTHALPLLSYRIPEHLKAKVRVGSAVVAPLSGRLRLGVVIARGESGGRARED